MAKPATDENKAPGWVWKIFYLTLIIFVIYAYRSSHPSAPGTQTANKPSASTVVLSLPQPVPAPPRAPEASGPPTLRILPESATVKACVPGGFPENEEQMVKFRAFYDPDGPGPEPEREIYWDASWRSGNIDVAPYLAPSGQNRGVFGGKTPGQTTVIASFNGAKATAQLTVE